jgi:transcription initiation factor TFIIB
VKRKDVARSYRLLVLELGVRIPVVNPMKCVARVANKLSISEKTKHQALNIHGRGCQQINNCKEKSLWV